MFYRRYGKRIFDTVVAGTALLLFSPLLVLVYVLVLFKLGSPVFFRQRRLGRDGEIFCLHKFRTMTDATDAEGRPLPDEIRLTAFGRLLRSTSLDELPELFDVLRGKMSLVGPRPLLVHYRDRYSPTQWRRHEVLPGITGWAQVNGRNALTWPAKFRHDVYYVDHMSLVLDLRILAMTVAAVLKRSDISQDGEATCAEFTGLEVE